MKLLRWLVLASLYLPSALHAQEQTVPFQGVDRHFLLHLPPRHDAPLPLVIGLPGLGESPEQLARTWTMDAVADREGFAVLYPAELKDHWSYTPARAVALPDGTVVDDVGFILGLVDRLAADRVIDPTHVSVAGVSNGGLMAFTLACRAPDRFAAMAAIITGMLEEQVQQCHPSRLVPLMLLDGTADYYQFYDGSMGPGYRLTSVPETIEFWRRQRGCLGKTLTLAPAHEASDPTQAVMIDWTQCTDPAPLRYWRIDGGGHNLPSYRPLSERERAEGPHGGRSQAIETAEEAWRFFALAGR